MADKEILKRAWFISVLAYAVIRTALIWGLFSKYGVNPYLYLIVDVVAAYFYAVYSTKLITSKLDSNFIKYLLLTVIFNFIPDIYVLATAREVPKFLLQGFIEVVLLLAVIGGVILFKKRKTI